MVAKRGEAKSWATSASIDGTEFVDVTKGTGRHYSYQTPWQIGLVARSKPNGTVTVHRGTGLFLVHSQDNSWQVCPLHMSLPFQNGAPGNWTPLGFYNPHGWLPNYCC